MLVTLRGQGPLSQQVYGALRGAILAGNLAAGGRLPSTRSLARELEVSRNTVLLAYDQLLAEGYIAGRTGSGTYVAETLPDAPRPALGAGAPRVAAHAPRLSAYGRRVVDVRPATTPRRDDQVPYDFRYGLPTVAEFPHAVWRRLLGRHARPTTASMGYGPREGTRALREAIAAYLRRVRGVVCDAEQVLVVNGSQQALDLAARVLLDPGARVVLEEPHYQGARWAFHAAGARLVPVPVDADGLDIARLGRARARLVYVTPSHQFPTGVVMSLPRRLALLEWARTLDAWVVEDDYDSEYRYGGRPIEAVQGLDRAGRVIYAGTLSKVLFPALRLGYLVLPPALVEPFRAAKWVTDRHSPTLEQDVLAEFIADGHFERHLRRARTRYAARRAALLAALASHLGERAEVVGANAGMHVLVWLRDVPPRRLPALISAAAREGVGVYSIAPYFFRPPRRAGLILGYAPLTETQIREGIARLGRALTSGARSRDSVGRRDRR